MECDYDYDDGEHIDFQRLVTRKARKEHRCDDCGGVIKAGESYELHTMGVLGTVETNKRCADCDFLVHEVGRTFYENCGGWQLGGWYGGLRDAWDDHCERILDEDNADELVEQSKRIAAMQRASAEARGGNIFWRLPEPVGSEA